MRQCGSFCSSYFDNNQDYTKSCHLIRDLGCDVFQINERPQERIISGYAGGVYRGQANEIFEFSILPELKKCLKTNVLFVIMADSCEPFIYTIYRKYPFT